ncbi:MAG: endolytic transglycosylase MltG [Candidatus Parcubacteria bacterium]|nr:endolytic transglycosylase MltG [Candidatus Parcubacteria bacterium]
MYSSFFVFAPASFIPKEKMFEIPEGYTLAKTADMLENKGIIRSGFFLRAYIALAKNDHPVISGFYLLSEKEPLYIIANRIVSGEYRISKVKILIPEGFDSEDIKKTVSSSIPSFEGVKFLSLAKQKEGYLFPDTYFFFSIVKPEEVVVTMRNNFDEKIKPIESKIKASGHSLSEIIIMASIIEREAVTPEDRRIVSGILWKRIKLGMPLQVDAVFDYVNGKTTHSLTAEDLKADSPYNTYTNKGLPPGPICNPGIDAILAAVEPTKTAYLYYLSDKTGKIHYAKTFDEHVRNKQKYLK